MSTLQSEPLSLLQNELISLRVSASNHLGQGAWSQEVTDSRVRTVPAQMVPVTSGSLSNDKQIEVLWQAFATEQETGYS